jgi:dolichyl-phosphate beta-glucosyltransferase
MKLQGFIVIPCFNEANRLQPRYFHELAASLLARGFELVFVDDGSTDDTLLILKREFAQICHVITIQQNVGKANAIRQGFQYIDSYYGEGQEFWVGYLDADSAFDLSTVVNFIDESQMRVEKRWACFSAARVGLAGHRIRRSKLRHFVGRIIVTLCNSASKNLKIYDPQSGLKLFNTQEFSTRIFDAPFKTRWFMDWEIFMRMPLPRHVLEIPATSWSEIAGSKIRIKSFLTIFRELVVILLLINRKSTYGSN